MVHQIIDCVSIQVRIAAFARPARCETRTCTTSNRSFRSRAFQPYRDPAGDAPRRHRFAGKAPGLGARAAFVEFVDVEKSYDGRAFAVTRLNLSVARGEFLTLLGPSGSGKTTTLMMLAGFEAADRRRDPLDGRPIDSVPPHKRNIGMVFQNYALFPHMTRRREPRLPAAGAQARQGRDRRRGSSARSTWCSWAASATARPGAALRRPAAARRAGPRAGVRARAGADGRAARRARQAAARAHAARDQAPARPARRHRRLRHPRPERGADHVGPRRRLQRRRASQQLDPPDELYERAGQQLRRAASSARTTRWRAASSASPARNAASR